MAGTTGTTDRTIEIDLGDGAILHAEVRDDRPVRDSGDAGAVSTAVRHTFAEVRSTIRSVGQWAKDTAAECGDPSTFEVEFGLTLSVKSGRLIGVLAEAGGEAALVVRLSWDRTTADTTVPTDSTGSTVPVGSTVPADTTVPAGSTGSATAGTTA